MIDLENFAGEHVDVAIRWGNGRWTDCEIESLLACSAWPTGNRAAYERIRKDGMERAFYNGGIGKTVMPGANGFGLQVFTRTCLLIR